MSIISLGGCMARKTPAPMNALRMELQAQAVKAATRYNHTSLSFIDLFMCFSGMRIQGEIWIQWTGRQWTLGDWSRWAAQTPVGSILILYSIYNVHAMYYCNVLYSFHLQLWGNSRMSTVLPRRTARGVWSTGGCSQRTSPRDGSITRSCRGEWNIYSLYCN